jgi:hypothetical protein
VFGVLRRGGAERALADHVQPHPAVRGLAGLIAVDADLLAQLLGDVTGVPGIQPQRQHIRPVGLRWALGGVGHLGDAGNLGGGSPQQRDRVVDVGVAGIRAGRRHQGQRGRPLVVVELLELVVDEQRLRTGNLETAAGEIPRLRQGQIDRRNQSQQPAGEDQPAVLTQAAAQAHH